MMVYDRWNQYLTQMIKAMRTALTTLYSKLFIHLLPALPLKSTNPSAQKGDHMKRSYIIHTLCK